MAYTEVTSQGWFSRIGDAFKGMLFGLVLFIGSFILLGWNENNYVERYKALKEGQGNTVSVTSDSVDASNEGKPFTRPAWQTPKKNCLMRPSSSLK